MKHAWWIFTLTLTVVLLGASAVLFVALNPKQARQTIINRQTTAEIKTSFAASSIQGSEVSPRLTTEQNNTSTIPVILTQSTSTTSKIGVKETEDPTVSSTVNLLFLGDVMLDRNVADRSHRAGDLFYPFKMIAGQDENFFKSYNAVIANLEGPVTSLRAGPDKGEVDFAIDPKFAPILKTAGISYVSQANNHVLDQGRAGADESKKLLSAAGITAFGDEVYDSASHALVYSKVNNQNIALIAWNISDNPLDKKQAEQVLLEAKKHADKIIVFMHWGDEYQAKPNSVQIDLAHWFIDNDADFVIGSHPHWVQSVEVYKNHAIIYSLGNFIFDQDWSTETQFGLIVGITLTKQTDEFNLYPIKIVKSQPVLLIGNDRQARLDKLAEISNKDLSEQIKNGSLKLVVN